MITGMVYTLGIEGRPSYGKKLFAALIHSLKHTREERLPS